MFYHCWGQEAVLHWKRRMSSSGPFPVPRLFVSVGSHGQTRWPVPPPGTFSLADMGHDARGGLQPGDRLLSTLTRVCTFPAAACTSTTLPCGATVTVTWTDSSLLNTDQHFSKEKNVKMCFGAFVDLSVVPEERNPSSQTSSRTVSWCVQD